MATTHQNRMVFQLIAELNYWNGILKGEMTIEIKTDKGILIACQTDSKNLLISVTENEILTRNVYLNKRQLTNLINYLGDRRKEMKS